MAISNKFNPLAQFVVKTTLKSGGRDYQSGELVPSVIQGTRLRLLYEEGVVWYGWQQKASIAAAKKAAKDKEVVAAKKEKERKAKSTPEVKLKKTDKED